MAKKTERIEEPEIDSLGRETFIHAYLTAGRFTAEVEALCREEGLTMSHYTVLWFLTRRHSPAGIPMGALADGHLNRASDITRLADRLVKDGFMERFASENDRRVVLARITSAGRQLFVRLTARIKALHRKQWEALSIEELRRLNELLAKVLWTDGNAQPWKHPLIDGDAGAAEGAGVAETAAAAPATRKKRS